MKNKQKYHTVGTIPTSNIEIVERGKFDISNKPLAPLAFVQSNVVELNTYYGPKPPPISEMMCSCKCFLHVNKGPTI